MEANIIKVGNSKGIIIPSKFLKLIGFGSKVTIEIEGNKMVIVPIKELVRAHWGAVFEKAHAKSDPDILLPDVFEDESFEEWTW